MRGRHRRALVELVAPGDSPSPVDCEGLLQHSVAVAITVGIGSSVAARCGEIDINSAVGVARALVEQIGRCDPHGSHVAGGVVHALTTAIARGGSDEHSRGVGVEHGLGLSRRVVRRAEAEVDHVCAGGDCVVDASDHSVGRAISTVIEDAYGQDGGVIGEACDSGAIVGCLGDGACHVGAVAVPV